MEKITEQQIAAWKQQYGDVYKITVDGRECYLKSPSRKGLGYASQAGQNNPMKFNEVLLNDCWLGGDEEIKTNDTLFISIGAHLAKIIDVKESEMVKL
jgi:hypothetical protein